MWMRPQTIDKMTTWNEQLVFAQLSVLERAARCPLLRQYGRRALAAARRSGLAGWWIIDAASPSSVTTISSPSPRHLFARPVAPQQRRFPLANAFAAASPRSTRLQRPGRRAPPCLFGTAVACAAAAAASGRPLWQRRQQRRPRLWRAPWTILGRRRRRPLRRRRRHGLLVVRRTPFASSLWVMVRLQPACFSCLVG